MFLKSYGTFLHYFSSKLYATTAVVALRLTKILGRAAIVVTELLLCLLTRVKELLALLFVLAAFIFLIQELLLVNSLGHRDLLANTRISRLLRRRNLLR